MKIGFFTDAYFPQVNGVVTSVYETARELRRKGHEVFIIAPKYPNYEDEDKFVIRLSSVLVWKKLNIRLATHLPDKTLLSLYGHKFDIIHVHGVGTISLLGLEIAGFRDVPAVLTYHTLWSKYSHYVLGGMLLTPKTIERMSKILCNRFNAIIAPSNRAKEELLSYGVKRSISVFPTGLNFDKFKDVEKGYLRKRLGIKSEDKILLYVGRLGKEKSVDFILHAFKLVYVENKKSVLIIVGEGPDRKELERLASDLGLKERIYFLGNIELGKMPLVYADSDLFVFASQTETQGICVLEAAASGLPVVVVKDSALDNLNIDGNMGFVVSPNQEIFIQKITKLLKDNILRRQFGENAREIVKKNFRIEHLVDELLVYYEKVLGDYKPRGRMLGKINRATLAPLLRVTSAINKFLNS